LNAQSFNKAYTIRFKNAAGEESSQQLKGTWKFFFGDLFIHLPASGGLLYILDMATGKAYYMPEVVNLQISYNPGYTPHMMIAALEDLRPEMRRYLIPMEEGSYQFIAE
jgi:hypothetical protein